MMRLLPVILCLPLFAGCAFTVHDVEVGYEFDDERQVDVIGGGPVEVGEFVDARGVENPRMIMNMQNLNGDTTSGGYQAEAPLAELVRDALIQGFEAANLSMASDAPLILTGELQSFDTEIVMGFWEGTFKGSMAVRMELVDRNDGRIVWRDTFVANTSVEGGEKAEGLFRATLDDFVMKVLNDRYFRQQLTGADATTAGD